MKIITPHSLFPILDDIFINTPNITYLKSLIEIKKDRNISELPDMTDPIFVNLSYHANGNKLRIGWDQYIAKDGPFGEETLDLRKYENEITN